ncbi:MAG TPA: hypothetical protein VFA66_13305 [Gaiellaceae bacterium]|nr:hypothetical protein [Gaiellaceae bacterium]
MRLRSRSQLLCLAGVAATLAIVSGASAAATPAGAIDSGTCSTWPPLVQPFLPWADQNPYFLLQDSSFEAAVSGWTLTGGATVVAGNEPFFVTSRTDTHSLALPTTASSVTTPTVCVTSDSPSFRFFLRNNGNLGYTDGQLAVYLNFTGASGKPQQVKIAALKGSKTNWALTPSISFIQYISTPLKSGAAQISFTIRPNDNHGNWQLDDFYVDPFKGR